MTALWTSADLTVATKGIQHGPNKNAQKIVIDSRDATPNDAFIAIKGPNKDGHDYIPELYQKGIRVFIGEKVPEEGFPEATFIQVSQSFEALYDLARFSRKRTQAKLPAITGSFGKTTVKECLHFLLSRQGQSHCAEGSYNNHWGVPLTLVNLPQEADYGVIEIGMNNGGEIAPLTALTQPHVALVNNVGGAHEGHFSSHEAIAEEKGQIFTGLVDGGVALLNGDQPEFFEILKAQVPTDRKISIKTFGQSKTCDFRLLSLEQHNETQTCRVHIAGEEHSYSLPFVGTHWAMNTLAALSLLHLCGGNVKQATQDLSSFSLLPGRGRILDVSGIRIIDETFNSNPQALAAALETFSHQGKSISGRRIAILGDMLELQNPEESHQKIAPLLKKAGVDLVCTSGPLMDSLWNVLPSEQRGMKDPDPRALGEALAPTLKPGDLLLVKGSKGQRARQGRMLETIKAIENYYNREIS